MKRNVGINEMKPRATKALRLSGVFLGVLYFYWGFAKWDIACKTGHPLFCTSLTFLYGILLVAPWTYFGRLRIWIVLYVFFVLFSLWMILSHLVGLLATVVHPQFAAFGILAMLIVEISQIPVLLIMKRNPNQRFEAIGDPGSPQPQP